MTAHLCKTKKKSIVQYIVNFFFFFLNKNKYRGSHSLFDVHLCKTKKKSIVQYIVNFFFFFLNKNKYRGSHSLFDVHNNFFINSTQFF